MSVKNSTPAYHNTEANQQEENGAIGLDLLDEKNNNAAYEEKKTAKIRPARYQGRKSIIKERPRKLSSAETTPLLSSIYYKGSYIKIGDIVSMKDEDGGTYYAQIRGLFTDQYYEKSAVVTRLVPMQKISPQEKEFNPAKYIIGPEDDTPKKLEGIEFVMMCSDYFMLKNSQRVPIGMGSNGHPLRQ